VPLAVVLDGQADLWQRKVHARNHLAVAHYPMLCDDWYASEVKVDPEHRLRRRLGARIA
jgi:hypothetical protein